MSTITEEPPPAPPASAAPYGVRADGSPRRRPGPAKGTRAGAAVGGGPGRPRKSAAAGRSARRGGADYAAAVAGLLTLPTAALTMLAAATPAPLSVALAADAATIDVYRPQLAEALGAVAAEQPAVARMLDRIITVGPYAAVFAAVLPITVQLAVNHGAVPAGTMGSVAPEAILSAAARSAPTAATPGPSDGGEAAAPRAGSGAPGDAPDPAPFPPAPPDLL